MSTIRIPLKLGFHRLAALALIGVCSVALCGCGIDFGGAEKGTELLKSVRIDGSPKVGSTMYVILSYTQVYEVDVDVRCQLEDRDGALIDIVGSSTISGQPTPEAGVTPTPESLSFAYSPKNAGTFWAVCETPDDTNNSIETKVEIAP